MFNKKSPAPAPTLRNIQAFMDSTHGQLTIGEIPPIRRAALAAEGKKMRAALISRDNETVLELLQRLDSALYVLSETGEVVDEVSPEVLKRRKR